MYSVEASPPYVYLWKVAIYNNVDTLFGPEYNTLLYIQNPWNAETSIFLKADRFPSPNITWTVQNLLDNPDACLLLL